MSYYILYQVIQHLVVRVRHSEADENRSYLGYAVLWGLTHELMDRIKLLLCPCHATGIYIHLMKLILAFLSDHLPHMRFQGSVPKSVRFQHVESIP